MRVGTVGRVHVTCEAPPEREQAALALRTRLVRTARVHLPAALEGSLVAEGSTRRRVFADRVRVRLDFDLEDYDDVTVATLWAGRVREALLRDRERREVAIHVFESDEEFYAAAAAEYARTGRLSWIFEELGCGLEPVGPLIFLSAFDTRERVATLAGALAADEGLAKDLYERLRPSERAKVVAALAGEEPWGGWRTRPVRPAPTRRPRRGEEDGALRHGREGLGRIEGEAGEAVEPEPWWMSSPRRQGRTRTSADTQADISLHAWVAALRRCGRTAASAVRTGGQQPRRTEDRADLPAASAPSGGTGAQEGALAKPRIPTPALEDAAVATGGDPDDAPIEGLAWWTGAGGLVLLYPWLEKLLGSELPPTPVPSGETTGRLWALATLADEEMDGLVLDPLVRLLAGDDPHVERSWPREPSPEERRVLAELARETLARFATALPGFERSTPGFLRSGFVRRGAIVEPGESGAVRVILEPLPLDPVLIRLPYPLGPFRLPWTPRIDVNLRGKDA